MAALEHNPWYAEPLPNLARIHELSRQDRAKRPVAYPGYPKKSASFVYEIPSPPRDGFSRMFHVKQSLRLAGSD